MTVDESEVFQYVLFGLVVVYWLFYFERSRRRGELRRQFSDPYGQFRRDARRPRFWVVAGLMVAGFFVVSDVMHPTNPAAVAVAAGLVVVCGAGIWWLAHRP